MSGHSKWATTKRAKAVVDAKRASAFTRLAHTITIAARDKGADPLTNFNLRLAIEKARGANMPKENIERAIQRGAGTGEGGGLEEILYEGFGPGGCALLISAVTDNRNRTVAEVKHLLSKNGGTLGSANSVQWMFERVGMIGIDPAHLTPERELGLIEAGAQDILQEDEGVTILTAPADFERIKGLLEGDGIGTAFAEIAYRPTQPMTVDDDTRHRVEHLVEELEDQGDVTECSTNLA